MTSKQSFTCIRRIEITDTKENILQTALRLFSTDGYEAVSVREIAGELEMTKGALYKHYKNKRDIFDCIVQRMYQIDYDRAKEHEVPEEMYEDDPLSYHNLSLHQVGSFMKAQFQFWNEDEFACNFRKLLVLEQYRNPEMADLYQKCLVSGPVSYTEDLFREMIKQGVLEQDNPKLLALTLFSPFYLLLSTSGSSLNKEEATNLLTEYIERFINEHTK